MWRLIENLKPMFPRLSILIVKQPSPSVNPLNKLKIAYYFFYPSQRAPSGWKGEWVLGTKQRIIIPIKNGRNLK